MTDSSFRNNTAMDSLGGGAFCSGNARSIVFARTSFVNNSIPSGLGGAIFMNNTAAELRISTSSFHSNNASSGGALYLYVNTDLRLSLEDNRFQGNGASRMGKTFFCCCYNKPQTTILGGAIAINATGASENITISFVRNTISENEARFGGGLAAVLLQRSVYASDMFLSFSGDVFKNNNASGGVMVAALSS